MKSVSILLALILGASSAHALTPRPIEMLKYLVIALALAVPAQAMMGMSREQLGKLTELDPRELSLCYPFSSTVSGLQEPLGELAPGEHVVTDGGDIFITSDGNDSFITLVPCDLQEPQPEAAKPSNVNSELGEDEL